MVTVFAERDECMSQVFINNTADLEFCQDIFDYNMYKDEVNICVSVDFLLILFYIILYLFFSLSFIYLTLLFIRSLIY